MEFKERSSAKKPEEQFQLKLGQIPDMLVENQSNKSTKAKND